MLTRLAILIAVLAISTASLAQTAPEPEPPTLQTLHAASLQSFEDTADTVGADGHVRSDLHFRIELPALFHPIALGDVFGHTALFGIDLASPRFTIRHFEEGISRDLESTRIDFAVELTHGERDHARWTARVSTMRSAAYRAASMRPLPPGERRWIEMEVRVRQTTPTGEEMVCTMDVAPFSRARYGTPAALIDWALERCATITIPARVPR